MNTPLAAQLLLAWSESLNHTPRSFADWLEDARAGQVVSVAHRPRARAGQQQDETHAICARAGHLVLDAHSMHAPAGHYEGSTA